MLICRDCQKHYNKPYHFCPIDGCELIEINPIRKLRLNNLIETYRVLAKVQESDTEVVFLAKNARLDKEVFLWLLDPWIIQRSGSYEQIKNEILISKTVAHESIATQYDIRSIKDGPYVLITEALEGVSLADLLRKERLLCPKRAIHLARQICRALKAAHGQGIYHGGFNPRYLFVSTNRQGQETIKLCSFGIAKLIADYKLALVSKGDGSKVSPSDLAYISPEHARRRGDQNIMEECTEEIYSLGVLLYEMLAGGPLFEAKTAQAMIEAHKAVKAVPIRDRNPDFILYTLLDRSVLKALVKDQRGRYQSIDEFLLKLDELYQEVDKPKSAIKIDVSVEFTIKRRPALGPVASQPEILLQPATEASKPTPAPTGMLVDAPSGDSLHALKTPLSPSIPAPEASSPMGVPALGPDPARPRQPLRVYAALALLLILGASVLTYSLRRALPRSTAVPAVSVPSPQPPNPPVIEAAAPPIEGRASLTKPDGHVADITPVEKAKGPHTVESPAPIANATFTRRSAQYRSQSEALRVAFDGWIAATSARDLQKLGTFYMPTVSAFYRARKVSKATVLAEKARLFKQVNRVNMRAPEPMITLDDGRTATVRFRKSYTVKGKRRTRGIVQELRWMKTNEGWKITSERDLMVRR